MSRVDETPDVSEDEDVHISEEDSFEDSLSIVDSSFTKQDDSNVELFTGKKGKKIAIIESDPSEDEETASKVTSTSFRKSAGKRSSNSNKSSSSKSSSSIGNEAENNISIESSSINQHRNSERKSTMLEQSYRNVSSIISSRSPSPELSPENIISISSEDETEDGLQKLNRASEENKNLTTTKEIKSPYQNSTLSDDRNSTVSKVDVDALPINMESFKNLNISSTKDKFKKEQITDQQSQNHSSVNNVILLKLQVSDVEYKEQKDKVLFLQANLQKTKNFMRSINLNGLPDKGNALIKKYENLAQEAKIEEDKLNSMIVTKEIKHSPPLKPVAWENLEKQMDAVQPRTFGKQALETLNMQKSLTMDRLEQLHGSLKACPDSNTLATDPEGLKVELMPHQKHAVAWLLWREKQKPSGGILADDMGLGKTLTMISLTLKSLQEVTDENEKWRQKTSKPIGGTLVVCPASLLYQWEAEVKKHVKKGLLTVGLHHGVSRETKARRLARQDIVITTYGIASSEHSKGGALFEIKWRRIVLDEAHQVRNHKAQCSMAVCDLPAKSRWVLTGTPIHNKELDLYSLLKFLRCTPFDDLTVWKRWVANKSTGGQDRLNTVMSSLILRRTKQQLEEKKTLTCLPTKEWKLIEITLEKEEMDVYQKVLIFSRTLFAQFLHQRAEKNSDSIPVPLALNDPNSEYYKMHQQLVKLNRVKNIKQHEILVLLLRLRQICCHPSLITKMLQGEEDLDPSETEGQEELNILEQLNKLSLEDGPPVPNGDLHLQTDAVGLAQASRNILNPSHPVFAEERRSTKVKTIMKLIEEIPKEDKIIVVSQWTKLLSLITVHLKQENIKFYQLDGSVNVSKRMEMVENFNKSSCPVRILLLSLTAGGVGLNLVGANHLILGDLHWNPQLERQAQDRIYRVGQSKPVNVYKLMAVDTIEQRIKHLQDKKLNLAEELLTGARIQQHNKLSLDDLKMLFNM